MEPNNNKSLRQGQQVQDGTVQFDEMTGRKLSEGQFSNPVGAEFDINTGKKISTSLLKEDVRPLTIPSAVPDTTATGTSAYVDSISTPAPVQPTTPQAPSRKRLTELTQRLGQESSLLNKEFEKQGAFAEQDTVNTLRDEITAETNATNNRIERLRNESKGMTQEAIAGEISRIERDSASKKADLAIALSLAERRFDRVKGIAERKVEMELAPLRQELELEKSFYEENKELFSEQERRAFELKKLETQQTYDNKKQERNTISDLAVTVAGNGAPANVVSAVLNAANQESAILAAGTYFQKPTTKTGTINTINGLTGNPFYDALANASIGLPENQRIENNNRLTALISSGQDEKARELIKRTAYQSLTGTERAATVERSQAIDSLITIKEALNEYVAKTGDTNIVSGNIQDALRKIGTAGDPELAKIGTRITQALQIYRSSVTGAAWGEQEDQEYNQLFPSFKNTNKLNTAIVEGMLDALNANNRVYLETVLGGKDTYDAVFKTDTQAPQQPVVSNNVDLTQFQVSQPQTAEQFFQELNSYQLPDFSNFFN